MSHFSSPGHDLTEAAEIEGASADISSLAIYHAARARISPRPSSSFVRSRTYFHLKMIGDWMLACAGIILLFPFLLLIAFFIKLDSRGPALFRQKRVGYRNREFVCYKFRTMQVNSHRSGDRESAITREEDPRVTRLGRFLRRQRLDELPQMLNILRGEMSWIGPRPEAAELSHWYEGHLPNYKTRFLVRPGITGLAQVNQGHVTGVDATAIKLAYDLEYVRKFSALLDFVIALKTLWTVISGYGSK